ncbi:contact-dependent growth inhibition system immunity protein [Streptomyces sp. NPDC102274]|uniref:contact-dependent growth inhibition system immunity protein n=1 Tax=Streptomyces sp. NPDC102274 TaxID=3366151 RepID=UPI0037F855DA
MYDGLRSLAGSYFHQDFDTEADTPIGVVEVFRDNEATETVEKAASEITEILDSGMSDEEIVTMWLGDFRAYYDPRYDDITGREWLTTVREILLAEEEDSDEPTTDGRETAGPETAGPTTDA